jgi:purine-binding chemotaxis protein CheW
MMIEPKSYLTFKIGNELFAVQVDRVHNIMELSNLITGQYKKSFVTGSINFRGAAVPVIDMRMKFDMHYNEYYKSSCVIIVDVNLKIEKLVIGILVDALHEVVELNSADDIPFGQMSLISGVFRKNDGTEVKIINPDEMFSEFEIEVIKKH